MRVKILQELATGVKCVSGFEEFLNISQPNASQHLSLHRRYFIIDYFIDGRLRYYFLYDAMVPDLIEILKKEYPEDLPAPACCPITKKGRYPGERRILMKTGIIIYSNDLETLWNAFRFGNFSLKAGDTAKFFLTGRRAKPSPLILINFLSRSTSKSLSLQGARYWPAVRALR